MSRMASDETPDRDTLSSMKVSELRQMCSERSLLVSGKKDELISRLLGSPDAPESAPAASTSRGPEDIDDAIDRLIARVSSEAPAEEEPEEEEAEEEVLEAEIVVEEEPEPEIPETVVLEPEEEDPWFSGVIPSEEPPQMFLDDEDAEEPSLVITVPSFSGLKANWKPISTVAVVILLVGAIAFYFVQQDHSFTARPLRYGDH
ncbi:MAG TPA: hypothetical protein EYP01_03835, partial [Candidatus Poseidoniales archaeon]|nr:hypothetical protein [Candidatus Poseidoniales archaeon]